MLQQLVDLFSVQDPAKLRTVIAKQRAIILKLQVENAQLRRENRQLRRRLADAELRLLRQAHADAILIGGLHFAGLPTSRRACLEVGISERHWTRARALLRLARLHDGQMRVDDPADYERSLAVAVEKVTKSGMEQLRYRMPLCRQ